MRGSGVGYVGTTVVATIVMAGLLAGCQMVGVTREESFVTKQSPRATVTVEMDSFTMRADPVAVERGPVRFVATNLHARDIHELAVLRLRDNGTKQNAGEVEDLAPLASGEIVLDLPPGRYELACLIARGEAGSAVDHYAAGMHMPFEVR